jgi:hypothetical protein
MGQLRGILRTLADAATDPPGQVLAEVDEAIGGLALSTLATTPPTTTPPTTTPPDCVMPS